MSRNHRNRSWRSMWTLEPISRRAVHKSGVIALWQRSPNDPAEVILTLDDTARIDLARWDLEQLTEQAAKLWMEGVF
jgi:hypothetical protein